MEGSKKMIGKTQVIIGAIGLTMIVAIILVLVLFMNKPAGENKESKTSIISTSQTSTQNISDNISDEQTPTSNDENNKIISIFSTIDSSSLEASSITEVKPIDVNKVTVKDYLTYNMDAFITPYWKGNVVYNETLMFVQDKNGNVEAAPLLYTPLKILSVRSFNLKKEYKQGEDYTIEDGKIKLTNNTTIYSWPYNRYYPEKYTAGVTYAKTGGGYVSHGEYNTFFKTQIAVTYIHNSVWTGEKPVYKGDKLPITMDRLKNNKALRIVFYGDSITTGCNASGWEQINSAPYVPKFTDIVVEKLKKYYKNDKIIQFNTAVGGKDSYWGVQNVEALVNAHNPDLVFIAFGANDGIRDYNVTRYPFKDKIKQIMDAARNKNPNVEFVLVSTLIPNKEADGFCLNQESYESVLKELENENTGTIVAPMTSFHSYILTKKRYYDMTGNNINHPNDFLVRGYAQTICQLLINDFN